jgi:HemY protein
MLWSLLKIFVFLGLATALAFGVAWILETPGEVKIAFGGREFFISPIGFLIGTVVLIFLALVLLKLLGFFAALLRFMLGDETALSRFFARSRERRGVDALSDGMVALASGDARLALKKSATAEKLLRRPEVTRIVSAQAAEMAGDRQAAFGFYKDMLANDHTRFIGVQGLMQQKLEEGDTDTAMALAQKAFALKPDVHLKHLGGHIHHTQSGNIGNRILVSGNIFGFAKALL